MRTHAPIAFSLLLASQAVFASGFCEGGNSTGGTTRCPQLDAVYHLDAGPIVADYRDIDGVALAATQGVDFDVGTAFLQPAGNAIWTTTIAEFGVGPSLGGSGGVIAIRVSGNNGAVSVRADYFEAGPYWSTANRGGSLVAQDSGGSVPMTPGDRILSVSVQPAPDWRHVQVYAEGQQIGSFVLGTGSVGYNLMRVRSGIISASAMKMGMSAYFEFYFRTYAGQDS